MNYHQPPMGQTGQHNQPTANLAQPPPPHNQGAPMFSFSSPAHTNDPVHDQTQAHSPVQAMEQPGAQGDE